MFDVDDESTIIQLGEWYHGPFPPDVEPFRETGHVVYGIDYTFIAPGTDILLRRIHDAGLVNGVGRYIDGPDVPFPVFNVVAATRDRLILINNAPRSVFHLCSLSL